MRLLHNETATVLRLLITVKTGIVRTNGWQLSLIPFPVLFKAEELLELFGCVVVV